jgi:DNA-binding transcriptional regulator YdaS (Cro superfamily)
MARDLKVHPDKIAEWAWGRRELSPDHPIFAALAVMVQCHDEGVAKACKIMDLHQA